MSQFLTIFFFKWHFLESLEFLNFRLNLSASWNRLFFESVFFFSKKALCQSSKNEAANLKKTFWFKIICKINDFEFSCCFDCGQLSVGSMNAIDCCCVFILFYADIVCGVKRKNMKPATKKQTYTSSEPTTKWTQRWWIAYDLLCFIFSVLKIGYENGFLI